MNKQPVIFIDLKSEFPPFRHAAKLAKGKFRRFTTTDGLAEGGELSWFKTLADAGSVEEQSNEDE